MRLIDADGLKSYIDCGHIRPPTEMCFSELDVIRMLDRQPTIDAEPMRRGRWVKIEGFFCCSECGCSPADWEEKPNNPYGLPPYCHACGAKMDAEPKPPEPRKTCPATGLECIECVPGYGCAKTEGGASDANA